MHEGRKLLEIKNTVLMKNGAFGQNICIRYCVKLYQLSFSIVNSPRQTTFVFMLCMRLTTEIAPRKKQWFQKFCNFCIGLRNTIKHVYIKHVFFFLQIKINCVKRNQCELDTSSFCRTIFCIEYHNPLKYLSLLLISAALEYIKHP